MEKKRKNWKGRIFLILLLVVVMAVGILAWYVFVGQDYSARYKSNGRVLENPVNGLSLEEAIKQFNDDDVYYLSIIVEAYNLHNAPFSDDTPKIELNADGEVYSVEVIEGQIIVERGEIYGEDITIYSAKEEIVKMLMDPDYIVESFGKGLSSVELVEDEVTLAAKGYLQLHETLIG